MRLAVVLSVSLIASSTSFAEDWPAFRGPTGMGVSTSKNTPIKWGVKENITWKTELPGGGTSSPVIFGDKIYLTAYTGFGLQGQPGSPEQLQRHVLCLDKASGKILWTKTLPSVLPDGPPPRDNHGFASSTPVVDGDGIYVFFGKSGVFALDHAGNQKWHQLVGSEVHGWGTAASPIVYKDLLIVNASIESESLFAFDKKTGKERWRQGGIRDAWNTPLVVPVGGKNELVVPVPQRLLAFEPETGKPLWTCKTDINAYMVPSVVAENGVIYCIGGRPSAGFAVRAGGRGDVTATHRLWKINKGSIVSSPIIHQGHLYWMHESMEIAYCADAKSGRFLYEQRIPNLGQVYSSPVLADGKIYYLSRMGKTAVVLASPKFQQVGMSELGGRQPGGDRSDFNASPAIADGRVYLRSDRFLYCIGGK